MTRFGVSVFAIGCVLAVSQNVSAQTLFKCEGADGGVSFTDKACPSGSTSSVEQRATEAQYQSQADASDPQKQAQAQEAHERNMAMGQRAKAEQQAEAARQRASLVALNAGIAEARQQDDRVQLDNDAKRAQSQVGIARYSNGVSPEARVQLQQNADRLTELAVANDARVDADQGQDIHDQLKNAAVSAQSAACRANFAQGFHGGTR